MTTKKQSPLFDILNSINEKKDLEFEMKDYNPFMVNRGLSMNKDTIFYALEMSISPQLDKVMQYDFYFNAISKCKRYNKWCKKIENESDIELIKACFKCNNQLALRYAALLSVAQIEVIKNMTNEGG